ncbi:MAG: hypothetical protein IH914_02670 [candidate division Zixibacteria bacterium]|nr:hypothetical protein [candidate division Zixibacteria bacterium]
MSNKLYVALWEDEQARPIFIFAVIIDILLLILTRWLTSKKRHNDLLNEFDLLVTSEDMKPNHMGYQTMEIDEQQIPKTRPHYPFHSPRRLIEGEKKTSADSSKPEIEESALSEFIKRKQGFVIIGPSMAGKSRTLYAALKTTPNIIVMKPRKSKVPSDDALRLCGDKLTVILLDDLNEFATSKLDIKRLLDRLDYLKIDWTIACTCRGDDELGAVTATSSGAFLRIYESLHCKFIFKDMTDDELLNLNQRILPSKKRTMHQMGNPSQPGHVTMKDALESMKIKFSKLDDGPKICLAALQLLVAGVVPLTFNRVTAVMQKVFNRSKVDSLPEILQVLHDKSFINSEDRDPITPDMAYLTQDNPARRVVTNTLNLVKKEELKLLAQALESINDARGIFNVACTLGEMDCSKDAIETYDKLIDKFGAEKEAALKEPVAMAMFNKGVTQGALDKSEDEIETYDKLIDKFGAEKESALKESVARAMVNKGVAQRKLNRPDDSFSTLCKAWARKDDLIPEHRTLLEKAFKALNRSPADCP